MMASVMRDTHTAWPRALVMSIDQTWLRAPASSRRVVRVTSST
jgi:hypothetical protein